MSGPWPGRDGGEIEAFILDRYLDSLLSRQPTDERDVPDDLRGAARRLAGELTRQHPSFAFEERLSARLASLASALAQPAVGPPHAVVPLPVGGLELPPGTGRVAVVRPVLIGGVLTSAALSLAGAAFVAWRRSRPGDPMRRAARAVARARTA